MQLGGEHRISGCVSFFVRFSCLKEQKSQVTSRKKSVILRTYQAWDSNWKVLEAKALLHCSPLSNGTCASLPSASPRLSEATVTPGSPLCLPFFLALISLLTMSFLCYVLVHGIKTGKLINYVSMQIFFVSCSPTYGTIVLRLNRWKKKHGNTW